MRHLNYSLLILLLASLTQPSLAQTNRSGKSEIQSQPSITYSDVAPIFNRRCIKCHSFNSVINGGHPPAKLSLESYKNIMRGGDRVVVFPARADISELVLRIRGHSKPTMPFDGPPWLSRQEVHLISNWVRQGAKDDDGKTAPPPVGQKIRVEGRLTDYWAVNGVPLITGYNTRFKKKPELGDYVTVKGVVGQDGQLYATKIRRD